MENLKNEFDQNGFIFKPRFFTFAESQEIKDRIKKYIKEIAPQLPKSKVFYEDPEDLTSIKQMFDMSEYDPFFKELLWEGKIKNLAEELLGEGADRGSVEYFNKPAGIGKPTPPHQDSYYFMLTPPNALTFWIPMEDVDEENGCLHYVRGSHKKGMRPHGRTETLGFSQGITNFGTEEDIRDEIPVPAEVGDILVHHGMTIHRAEGNNSKTRSRRVLGLVYFGESAQEDLLAKEQYQKVLREESGN